jgi:hypothetical protein
VLDVMANKPLKDHTKQLCGGWPFGGDQVWISTERMKKPGSIFVSALSWHGSTFHPELIMHVYSKVPCM